MVDRGKYGNDKESWLHQKRDFASLVAVFGPLVMVVGLIGTWHVLHYRVDQLELKIERAINRLDIIRDEQNRRTGIFESMQKELEEIRRLMRRRNE